MLLTQTRTSAMIATVRHFTTATTYVSSVDLIVAANICQVVFTLKKFSAKIFFLLFIIIASV